jgi:rare lipoprotein A
MIRLLASGLLSVAAMTMTQPAGAGNRNIGMASFYPGRRASMNEFTAAHPSLPFGTHVRVTTVGSGKSVIVRINDRGPFIHGRIIDVSRHAAESLGMLSAGVTRVRLEVVKAAANHVLPRVFRSHAVRPAKGVSRSKASRTLMHSVRVKRIPDRTVRRRVIRV